MPAISFVGVEATRSRPFGCEYVDLKAAWSGCGFEALAPKRDFQALRAEAWTEEGSSRSLIVTLVCEVVGFDIFLGVVGIILDASWISGACELTASIWRDDGMVR